MGEQVEDVDKEADPLGPSGRAKRATKEYTADDVYYVSNTPRNVQGTLQVATFVEKGKVSFNTL